MVALVLATGMKIGPILVFAGACSIASGYLFRRPVAVQPMKAIAAVAIADGLTTTEVGVAGLGVGMVMLLLGITIAAQRIERWIPLPIVRGIQLGVGV